MNLTGVIALNVVILQPFVSSPNTFRPDVRNLHCNVSSVNC